MTDGEAVSLSRAAELGSSCPQPAPWGILQVLRRPAWRVFLLASESGSRGGPVPVMGRPSEGVSHNVTGEEVGRAWVRPELNGFTGVRRLRRVAYGMAVVVVFKIPQTHLCTCYYNKAGCHGWFHCGHICPYNL